MTYEEKKHVKAALIVAAILAAFAIVNAFTPADYYGPPGEHSEPLPRIGGD